MINTETTPEQYGANVRARRQTLGLSLEAFAEMLPAARATVFNVEKARHRPHPSTQRLIEIVLDQLETEQWRNAGGR